ncbi:hypothetical protein O181_057742 [Austropuccinia psidii MF-1]|uniref:Uncharacterized protein n=1 Tax=Austropuccinia psidii MF-1 TaxID=1389203 RepID=A0A9Q3EID2_9BASI|nr:hypothetical protein [Austropuccinia psidii MF-1]
MSALQANLRQLTPGPSGTQWLEDLSHEPSQNNEPPIPGLSPSSEPPEVIATREPEPEVSPTQSMEEPFSCPATPCSIIIIENTPIRSHQMFQSVFVCENPFCANNGQIVTITASYIFF